MCLSGDGDSDLLSAATGSQAENPLLSAAAGSQAENPLLSAAAGSQAENLHTRVCHWKGFSLRSYGK